MTLLYSQPLRKRAFIQKLLPPKLANTHDFQRIRAAAFAHWLTTRQHDQIAVFSSAARGQRVLRREQGRFTI